MKLFRRRTHNTKWQKINVRHLSENESGKKRQSFEAFRIRTPMIPSNNNNSQPTRSLTTVMPHRRGYVLDFKLQLQFIRKLFPLTIRNDLSHI